MDDNVIYYHHTSLTSSLPEHVTHVEISQIVDIPTRAFKYAPNITHLRLSHIEMIGKEAFERCPKLQHVEIVNVGEIGDDCFYACVSLVSVSIRSISTILGNSVFEKCSLLQEANLLHAGTKRLSPYTFRSCTSLRLVTLPKVLETVGQSSFFGCGSLEAVMIPPGVEEISDFCFLSCMQLTIVETPSTTKLANATFYNCKALQSHTTTDGDVNSLVQQGRFRNHPLHRLIYERYYNHDEKITKELKRLASYQNQDDFGLTPLELLARTTLTYCSENHDDIIGLWFSEHPPTYELSAMERSLLERVKGQPNKLTEKKKVQSPPSSLIKPPMQQKSESRIKTTSTKKKRTEQRKVDSTSTKKDNIPKKVTRDGIQKLSQQMMTLSPSSTRKKDPQSSWAPRPAGAQPPPSTKSSSSTKPRTSLTLDNKKKGKQLKNSNSSSLSSSLLRTNTRRSKLVKKRNSVHFDSVHVQYHDRILGDNPSCVGGAPLSLDWKPVSTQEFSSLQEYEKSRPASKSRRNRTQLKLAKEERKDIILLSGKTTQKELEKVDATMLIYRKHRHQSNINDDRYLPKYWVGKKNNKLNVTGQQDSTPFESIMPKRRNVSSNTNTGVKDYSC